MVIELGIEPWRILGEQAIEYFRRQKLQLGLNYSIQRKTGLLFSCILCISSQQLLHVLPMISKRDKGQVPWWGARDDVARQVT